MVVVIDDNRKRASNATSFLDEVAQVQVVERQRTIFTWKIFCFGVVEWTRSAAQEEKKSQTPTLNSNKRLTLTAGIAGTWGFVHMDTRGGTVRCH